MLAFFCRTWTNRIHSIAIFSAKTCIASWFFVLMSMANTYAQPNTLNAADTQGTNSVEGNQAQATVKQSLDVQPSLDVEHSLDDELQALKKEILSLNRDLFILEEELLFPANTQVAVFLSMDMGEFFQLDAVTVKLNDKEVASHLYTEKQVDALIRGGMQRL